MCFKLPKGWVWKGRRERRRVMMESEKSEEKESWEGKMGLDGEKRNKKRGKAAQISILWVQLSCSPAPGEVYAYARICVARLDEVEQVALVARFLIIAAGACVREELSRGCVAGVERMKQKVAKR